jgi:predicted Fe-Mo cluster-binding NifX family protein
MPETGAASLHGTGLVNICVVRVAIANFEGRVSPVFDVARRLELVDVEDGHETARQEVSLADCDPLSRVGRLAGLGVEVLICGAISRPLEAAMVSAGIQVIAQTCGPVDEVLAAFAAGRLTSEAFLMPGSCGRRRRARHGQRHGRSPPRRLSP